MAFTTVYKQFLRPDRPYTYTTVSLGISTEKQVLIKNHEKAFFLKFSVPSAKGEDFYKGYVIHESVPVPEGFKYFATLDKEAYVIDDYGYTLKLESKQIEFYVSEQTGEAVIRYINH